MANRISYTPAQAPSPRRSACHAGTAAPTLSACPIARGAHDALTLAAIPVKLRRQVPGALWRRSAWAHVVSLAPQDGLRLRYTQVLQHIKAAANRAPRTPQALRPWGPMKRVSRRYRSRSRSGKLPDTMLSSYSGSGENSMPSSGSGISSGSISNSGVYSESNSSSMNHCRSHSRSQ